MTGSHVSCARTVGELSIERLGTVGTRGVLGRAAEVIDETQLSYVVNGLEVRLVDGHRGISLQFSTCDDSDNATKPCSGCRSLN